MTDNYHVYYKGMIIACFQGIIFPHNDEKMKQKKDE